MWEQYYMKNVILVFGDGTAAERFLPLIERLRREGIPVKAFLREEELPREKTALYITDHVETAVLLQRQQLSVLGFLKTGKENFAGIDYVMESPEELEPCYLERVYRRYHDIPWEIQETQRCIIRESTAEDVDSFFKIYSHPDIVKYMDDLYPEKEQEKAYIREYIEKVYRYFEFGVWTVLWKETGEVIGRAGFSVREGYDLPELGFVVAVPWQGKGIAYEICNAILQYGEEEFGFDRVQALVMPENKASLALCRKLGFTGQETVQEKQKDYLLLTRSV